MGVMKNFPVLRECLLVLLISLSVAGAIIFLQWTKHPEVNYRPLVQDLRLVDAVEVADVLDQANIDYQVDYQNHLLYVNQRQTLDARIALARVGISIDYPKFRKDADSQQAFAELKKSIAQQQQHLPIAQHPWFMDLMRHLFAALVLIVFILAVIKPMIRLLFVDKDNEAL